MCMIAKEIALKKKIHDSLLIVIEQMLLVGFLKKKTQNKTWKAYLW